MEKNQEFIVTIEDMNEDGAGVEKWMAISGLSRML